MVPGIQTCHSLYPVTVRHNLRKKFLKGETETKTLKGKARSQTCQVPLSAVIDENPVLVEEVHDFVDRLSLVLDGHQLILQRSQSEAVSLKTTTTFFN